MVKKQAVTANLVALNDAAAKEAITGRKGPSWNKVLMNIKLARKPTDQDLDKAGLELPFADSGADGVATKTIAVVWYFSDGAPQASFTPDDGDAEKTIEPKGLHFSDEMRDRVHFVRYLQALERGLEKLKVITSQQQQASTGTMMKASKRLTATEDNIDDNNDGKHSQDEIKEEIDKLDGVDGKKAADERRRLYDKWEDKKEMSKKAANARANSTKDLTVKAMKVTASSMKEVKAKLAEIAKMETADMDATAEKVLDIIKQRIKIYGAVKMFEAESFTGKGCTVITRHSNGSIQGFRMILRGNGFTPVNRTAKTSLYTRKAMSENGPVEIDVALVSGIPDVMTISVYNQGNPSGNIY